MAKIILSDQTQIGFIGIQFIHVVASSFTELRLSGQTPSLPIKGLLRIKPKDIQPNKDFPRQNTRIYMFACREI